MEVSYRYPAEMFKESLEEGIINDSNAAQVYREQGDIAQAHALYTLALYKRQLANEMFNEDWR